MKRCSTQLPALILPQAKGGQSEFQCGSPVSFWTPDLPGFKQKPGRGTFLYGRWVCVNVQAGSTVRGMKLTNLLQQVTCQPCLSVPPPQLQLFWLAAPWV